MPSGPFSPLKSACLAVVFLAALATVTGCSGGRDKLLAQLQSTRPDERALAVKKLAESNNAEDLVLFTSAAKDPVPIVRGEAITALGKSQDARVVDLLGEALGDPNDEVQAKAAFALAAIKNEKARAYLTLQYGRRGARTRYVIVQALKSANIPGAMAGVVAAEAKSQWDRNLQALQDGSLPEKIGAAEELGKSGRTEAVNRLTPLIRDSQVMLAAAAVRGLGYAGDKRAVGPISALLKETFPDLREAACVALSQLQDPSALAALREVALEKSPSSHLATGAIVGLPRSPETDKVLCEITSAGASEEAMIAGLAMRKRGSCPIEPLLEKLKSPSTTAASLQAIAALGPPAKEALPKLLPLLTSGDASIRRATVDALTELQDPAAGPAVVKAYEAELKALELLRANWVNVPLPLKYGAGFDPDAPADPNDPDAASRGKQMDLFKKVRARQDAKAQEQGKVVREAKPPAEVVDDATEDQLRTLAGLVRALGVVKAENAKVLVQPYLDESSPALRAAAAVALIALGGDGLELARPSLLDTERQVQGAAAQAFAAAGEPGQKILLEALPLVGGDRSRLLEALRAFPLSKAAIPTLIGLVKEGGSDAGTAALYLGQLQATEAVPTLLNVLEDPTAVSRREVLLALGQLKDPKTAETVGKDLYSDSAEIRVAAAEALWNLGHGNHLDALDALKGDYTVSVREAATKTLAHLGQGAPR